MCKEAPLLPHVFSDSGHNYYRNIHGPKPKESLSEKEYLKSVVRTSFKHCRKQATFPNVQGKSWCSICCLPYLSMGQRSSVPVSVSGEGEEEEEQRRKKEKEKEKEKEKKNKHEEDRERSLDGPDWTSILPDECLAAVFQRAGQRDRGACSLVCKRWYRVDAQTRQRLSLRAHAGLRMDVPAMFQRFENVTKLALRCNHKTLSVDDEALRLVGCHCGPRLRKLKLKGCRQLTDQGIEQFVRACGHPTLRKLSLGSCTFGAHGVNSLLRHCSELEDLTVKRLKGLFEGPQELIGPGSGNIRKICLTEIFNAQLFGPLIAGSKNLHTLILSKNSGNWDKLLEIIAQHVPNLVELHMEKLHLSDRGLQAVSTWASLEVLYVVKAPECTNFGLLAVANSCRKLKRLHIDGWKPNWVGDEALSVVGKKCASLQELVLIGVNATSASLGIIASNCPDLERLALCNAESVGDLELSSVAAKCQALKRLCLKSCPITDESMCALAAGCPQLVKVKIKKCRAVTAEGMLALRLHRPSLIVSLDTELPAAVVGVATELAQPRQEARGAGGVSLASSHPRSPLARVKLALAAGGSFVACIFLRWRSRHGS